jgi:hypothetical protein
VSNAQGCTNTFSKIIRAALPNNDIALTGFTISDNPNGTLRCIATLKNNGNININDADLLLNISGGVALREKIPGPILPGATLIHVVGYDVLKSSQLNYICAEVDISNDANDGNNKICAQIGEDLFLFQPYPNPVDDVLNIEWIQPNTTEIIFATIQDSMGKEVMSGSLSSSTAGLNRSSIAVDNLQAGFYILTINVGSVKKVQRFVISR